MAQPSKRVPAITEVDRVFAEATLAYPQSSPGVPKIGATALRLIQKDQLTGLDFSQREIADDRARLRKVVALTAGVHYLFGNETNPNPASYHLNQAIPFAYALVDTAVRAGARGMEGERVTQLELPTGNDHWAFERFTDDPEKVEAYRKVLSRAANVAHATGGVAEEAAATFRNDLLNNNDRLVAGTISHEAHLRERSNLQAEIGVIISSLVSTDIAARPIEGVDTDTALLAVDNVFNGMPGQSLVGHYFGQPLA